MSHKVGPQVAKMSHKLAHQRVEKLSPRCLWDFFLWLKMGLINPDDPTGAQDEP